MSARPRGAVQILSPEGQVEVTKAALAPFPSGDAPRIAVLDNGKPNARRLLERVAERVAQRLDGSVMLVTAKSTAATPAEPEILRQLQAADLVVTGSAD